MLPPSTTVESVRLRIADLSSMLPFYRDILGLIPGRAGGDVTSLAPVGGDRSILFLHEVPGVPRPPVRSAGLFHTALRVSSRRELGRLLKRVMTANYPLHGAADHLVSEAVYLADPEGNGIELYVDRPKREWVWRDGELAMATDPLDLRALLNAAEAGSEDPAGAPMDIGHIHLQIGHLASGEDFYGNLVGFDVVHRSYPGALFLSAGGYHHHIGLNIWGGRAIPQAPPDGRGLESFRIRIDDRPAHAALLERILGSSRFAPRLSDLADSGVFAVRDADGILVEFARE